VAAVFINQSVALCGGSSAREIGNKRRCPNLFKRVLRRDRRQTVKPGVNKNNLPGGINADIMGIEKPGKVNRPWNITGRIQAVVAMVGLYLMIGFRPVLRLKR